MPKTNLKIQYSPPLWRDRYSIAEWLFYNVAYNTGKVDGTSFLAATHELRFLWLRSLLFAWIFIVGKIAATSVYGNETNWQTAVYCIYEFQFAVLCVPDNKVLLQPVCSKIPSFGTSGANMGSNFPMAICYQMFLLRPVCSSCFQINFRRGKTKERK